MTILFMKKKNQQRELNNLRFSLLLLFDPFGEDPPGLEGNCSTFKSEPGKFISIDTSWFESVDL